MRRLTQSLCCVAMICAMLGMTSCAWFRNAPASRCPEFPVLTGVTDILDFAHGDSDILLWADVHAADIPLPIYEKLVHTYKPHPNVEEDMSRLLNLWDKLDLRNEN